MKTVQTIIIIALAAIAAAATVVDSGFVQSAQHDPSQEQLTAVLELTDSGEVWLITGDHRQLFIPEKVAALVKNEFGFVVDFEYAPDWHLTQIGWVYGLYPLHGWNWLESSERWAYFP